MPGWEEETIGYCGNDGNIYNGSQSGSTFGPRFKTNDVIGCGLELENNTVFFTKNGYLLGPACRLVDKLWYPTVGLNTKDAVVEINFGQELFVYDIDERHDEITSVANDKKLGK